MGNEQWESLFAAVRNYNDCCRFIAYYTLQVNFSLYKSSIILLWPPNLNPNPYLHPVGWLVVKCLVVWLFDCLLAISLFRSLWAWVMWWGVFFVKLGLVCVCHPGAGASQCLCTLIHRGWSGYSKNKSLMDWLSIHFWIGFQYTNLEFLMSFTDFEIQVFGL